MHSAAIHPPIQAEETWMESEECVSLLQGDHPYPEQRQIACGMMMQLDDGVGRVSDIYWKKEDLGCYTYFIHACIACNPAFVSSLGALPWLMLECNNLQVGWIDHCCRLTDSADFTGH